MTRPDTKSGDGLRLKSNLTLRKGATFHSPTTPPSSPPTTSFRVPSLPRRSQTNLDDVVDAHRRRAALRIGEIESSLACPKADGSSSRRSFRDDSLPVPKGFLDHTVIKDIVTQEPATMEKDAERRTLRPRPRRSSRHHESDSGLGTSIASKQSLKDIKSSGVAAAITQSVAAPMSETVPRLSSRAVNRIHEHTLKPLLAKPSLKDFHPIILDCPRRIQENQIICLRDLEKTLIFMAPERAKTAEMFLDFCETSIRCIQATVEYLSDREQTRPHDRSYSNGYFIDLVEQIRQHAQQMQDTRERREKGEEGDEMDVDPTDEVKLMGGLAATGRPAELIRIKKNGKAYSIATGLPVGDLEEETKSPVRFKRSMSEQLEDEEEIMRSMARRKKNASPEELAPKKCKAPGCNKEFKRPCDLTKHEKTHSRPWKCPIPTCKYHAYGWPTEKEMDRHVNDKHSASPPMFECLYKPCPYKSKRESNCKQHMEKAHGWTYVRTKTNGKKSAEGKASSSVQPTPQLQSMPTPQLLSLPTPSSDQSNNVMTPPEDFGYPDLNFPAYPSSEEFNAGLHFDTDIQLDYSPLEHPLDFSPIDNDTPSTDSEPFNAYQELSPDITGQFDDIYSATVQLPAQLPTPAQSVYNKSTVDLLPNFAPDLYQAPSAAHISPAGHGNTMLYTPNSLADEGFDELPCNDQFGGGDFLLFPPTDVQKPSEFDFNSYTMPSLAGGFTQPSSQDFNIEYNSAMDWTSTSEYNGFPNQQ